MAGTIVVGYDGTDEAHDALTLARSLAPGGAARLILVARLPSATGAGRAGEAEEQLAAEAAERLGAADFSLRAVHGTAADEALAEVAAAEAADVIAIGSTHRGRLGRVLPGSVGERLLGGSPCAVLIAPRGYARREHYGLGEIGVGFDGGEEAQRALRVAATVAAGLGARLRVIAVAPEGAVSGEPDPEREELQRALEAATAEVAGELESSTELLAGPPAAALAERGIELDLLVIGSRGHGPLRQVILGGVSAEVIRDAPCPVMVVPRSAGGRAGPAAG